MINSIIDGISIAVNAEFGDDYKIYTESIEQGLKEPCFSIVCLNPTNNLFRGKRYFRTNQFCIHYFPESEDKIAECMDVMDRLYEALEYINIIDDKQMGTQMHGEVHDGVLDFFVNYDFFTIKIDEVTAMEDMDLSTHVKG